MRKTLFSLIFLIGCGASGLEVQARASIGTREALDLAKSALTLVCDVDRVLEAEEPEALRDRCLRMIGAHGTSRATWKLWRDAILMAAASEDEEALARAWSFVAPILEIYGELTEFLAEFDVSLPTLPLGGSNAE